MPIDARMERSLQITQAIHSAIRESGDSQNWNAPQFAQARNLTDGLVWDFESWGDTLTALRNGIPREWIPEAMAIGGGDVLR